MNSIEKARELIAKASLVTVITGAGISTDSGIPDFRGPNGVWTLDPESEKITDITHYISSPKIRKKNWDGYVNTDWSQYEPNVGHDAIVKLYNDEKLLVCVTQNIDGLHIKAGLSEERVIEIHGSLRHVRCINCGEKYPAAEYVGKDPDCPSCDDGLLQPDVVFFGQKIDANNYHRAEMASLSCDVLLIVGTSLQVWPVADLPMTAKLSDVPIIYINGSSAPFRFDIELIGSISELLPQIV